MKTKIVSRNEACKTSKQSKKINSPPVPETEEHPDDKKQREESEVAAKSRIDAFMSGLSVDDLRGMILVYEDAKAEQRLAELRERFWTMD